MRVRVEALESAQWGGVALEGEAPEHSDPMHAWRLVACGVCDGLRTLCGVELHRLVRGQGDVYRDLD